MTTAELIDELTDICVHAIKIIKEQQFALEQANVTVHGDDAPGVVDRFEKLLG